MEPRTLEARVVSDADKLDAIGAIGIARAYAVAGRAGAPLWADLSEMEGESSAIPPGEHTPVHEFRFKLCRLKDRLYTATARAIAERRREFMVSYFAELAREARGEA